MCCDDCISRVAAIKAMEDLEQEDIEQYGCSIPEGFNSRRAVEVLESLPSILPKIGHWITHIHNGIEYMECSECSTWFLRFHMTRNSYCPNCGKKMEWRMQNEKG